MPAAKKLPHYGRARKKTREPITLADLAAEGMTVRVVDTINHPPHYTAHPSGVECITVTEHFGFNIGNAIKYLWRAGLKSSDPLEDLHKAAWYVNREIERLTRKAG